MTTLVLAPVALLVILAAALGWLNAVLAVASRIGGMLNRRARRSARREWLGR